MSLIEDAKAAKKAGLSYGQYMLSKEQRQFVRIRGNRCLNCGNILTGAKMKYCSKHCADQMKKKTLNGGKFV